MKTEEQKKYHREYMRIWRRTPKAKMWSKKWKKTPKYKKGQKESNMKYRDNTQFSGNRKKALERDYYTCQKCGKNHHEAKLVIHHIDGSGKGKNIHNNSMDNLVTLCVGCHMRIHSLMRKRMDSEGKYYFDYI